MSTDDFRPTPFVAGHRFLLAAAAPVDARGDKHVYRKQFLHHERSTAKRPANILSLAASVIGKIVHCKPRRESSILRLWANGKFDA